MQDLDTREEDLDAALNPHREEELQAAVVETVGRLHARGIEVAATERPEDLADLLTSVERFEDTVQAMGGDLFVDDLKSSQPDDRRFVVPRRLSGEPIKSYIRRVDEASAQLRSAAASRDGP